MPRTGFAISAHFQAVDFVELAQAAEARGYDTFWLTEGGGRDAVSPLAYIAAHTKRIKLGTGILTIYSRTPGMLAQTASALDQLSNGRFVLGLGTGHKAAVESGQGVPFVKPVTRMRDYVTIIKRALKDSEVSYKGGVYSVPSFTLGRRFTRPNLPVYIATLGGPLAELAGELADGVLPLMATPQGIGELRERIAAGAKRAGRDPKAIDVACFIIACASDDQRAAEWEARMQVARYARQPFYQKMLRVGGFASEAETMAKVWQANDNDQAARAVTDRMVESLTLFGPAAEWKHRLEVFRKAGVTQPVVYGASFGPDPKASLLHAIRMLSEADLR